MKKLTGFLLLFVLISYAINAQTEKKLKKVMELKITEQGGANGAGVVWHPALKKYYCPMAGNEVFPLQIFDMKGKLVSKPEQATLFDVRGMWYNPKTKKIYVNGYNEYGWAEYITDPKGNPTDKKILFEGLNQPGEQSVGTYDAIKNVVYFLYNNEVYTYSTSTGQVIGDPLKLNAASAKPVQEKADADSLDVFDMLDEETSSDYNSTTVIFTGTKNQEFGMLNLSEKRIDLFDRSTGNVTVKFVLPDDAPLNPMFNFAYTNGMYWLFNKETRVWSAYK